MSNTAKSPLEVVKAFNTAMEQKDFDTGLKYVADSCEYTNGPMGTFQGPAGVRAVLEPFFAVLRSGHDHGSDARGGELIRRRSRTRRPPDLRWHSFFVSVGRVSCEAPDRRQPALS